MAETKQKPCRPMREEMASGDLIDFTTDREHTFPTLKVLDAEGGCHHYYVTLVLMCDSVSLITALTWGRTTPLDTFSLGESAIVTQLVLNALYHGAQLRKAWTRDPSSAPVRGVQWDDVVGVFRVGHMHGSDAVVDFGYLLLQTCALPYPWPMPVLESLSDDVARLVDAWAQGVAKTVAGDAPPACVTDEEYFAARFSRDAAFADDWYMRRVVRPLAQNMAKHTHEVSEQWRTDVLAERALLGRKHQAVDALCAAFATTLECDKRESMVLTRLWPKMSDEDKADIAALRAISGATSGTTPADTPPVVEAKKYTPSSKFWQTCEASARFRALCADAPFHVSMYVSPLAPAQATFPRYVYCCPRNGSDGHYKWECF